MQDKAQKNFDASRDKSLSVFSVGVVFVNETSALGVSTVEADEVIEHVKAVVNELAKPEKLLHIVPLESIYELNPDDDRERLRRMLDAVGDSTGKEDVVTHLRMLCLQKVRQSILCFLQINIPWSKWILKLYIWLLFRLLWKMGTPNWYLEHAHRLLLVMCFQQLLRSLLLFFAYCSKSFFFIYLLGRIVAN